MIQRWLQRRAAAPSINLATARADAPRGGKADGFVTERVGATRTALRTDTAGLQDALSDNELVAACISVKATAARDPQLVVERLVTRRGGAAGWEIEPEHPLAALIRQPMPGVTEGDLLRMAIASWDCTHPRQFVAAKVRDDRTMLIGLDVCNPAALTPLRSRDGRQTLIGYRSGSGQAAVDYALGELIIRRAPVWADPGPLRTAMGSVASDTAQTQFIRSFFDSGGTPAGLLTYAFPLAQEERDLIRAKWRETYRNRTGGAHDVGVLDNNVTYQQTGSRLDQIASPQLRSVAESRICMVFGVPPLIVYAYVGLLRATYSNLDAAWDGFWKSTMSPLLREWRDVWSQQLLPEFEDPRAIGRTVRLRYDLSQVAALQDDVDAAQARARANYTTGGISLAEYRAAIGAPHIDGSAAVFAGGQSRTLTQVLQPVDAPVQARSSRPTDRRARKDLAGLAAMETDLMQQIARYLRAEFAAAGDAAREAA